MEIIVVGGGVIGLSVAWELATRGAAVRVLHRGPLGAGTTWAAAGILPATRDPARASQLPSDPIDALRSHSHAAYPRWAERIAEQTGIDVGLRRCGGIYLASTPGEAAALQAALEDLRDEGVAANRLTAAQLRQHEPQLAPWAESPQFRFAIRVDDEYQVRPPDLLRGLAAACTAAGVRIEQNVQVRVRRRGEQAVLECAAEEGSACETVTADQIVLCGGVWSGQAAAEFGLGLSLVPIRGQMLLYRFPTPPLRHIINEGHRYLVPRDDGHVLVGSCEEEVGFTLGTTPAILQMLAQWAASVAAPLRSAQPVRNWSGLRPATFDGFPIIGRMPEARNLWVATGHFRSGIHLAPATASLVADLVEHKPPTIDPSALAVGRALLQPSGTELGI